MDSSNIRENSLKSEFDSLMGWPGSDINGSGHSYDEIYSNSIGSIFTMPQFHELTPLSGSVEEDIWMLSEFRENTVPDNHHQNSISGVQIICDSDTGISPNYWQEDLNTQQTGKNYILMSPSSIPTEKHSSESLIVDESMGPFKGSNSDISSVSHASTLRGVWVVPAHNTDIQGKPTSKIENLSSDDLSSSINTSYSEKRRRIHFSRHRFNDSVDRTSTARFKGSNIAKLKSTDHGLSMLIASGGAPLGKLEDIDGVEWCPDRQSWKVTGHTGISWCVRRKTWRVWFITPNGTRATRSFNPKEHGTVATALKAAIEFLEYKRAEKSHLQKSTRVRMRRNTTSLFPSPELSGIGHSKSRESVMGYQRPKFDPNLIN
ncbi:AP2 domain-containing protein [Cryptosporidium andersoni]|uniref:AP2 domain-containing protein n=1 Tax=Cryptosporidium andersoni TaxID=117008 RepID=A0A1J4MVV7_9CRYT|nr:AP2 domain-containing protein [Cryptosporidium andersoni]